MFLWTLRNLKWQVKAAVSLLVLGLIVGVPAVWAAPTVFNFLKVVTLQATSLTLNGTVSPLVIQANGEICFDGTTCARSLGYDGSLMNLTSTIVNTGTYRSNIASPNNAFGVLQNGARIDFGAGASDYASSDGTTVSFAGPLTTSGNFSFSGSVVGTSTSGSALTSNISAVSATSSVAGILLKTTNALDSPDLILDVQRSDATSMFKVDASGNITASGSATKGTITLSAGSGTATVLSGAGCVCVDTTANASVKCAVSGTTLTATGTGTDVIRYLCL